VSAALRSWTLTLSAFDPATGVAKDSAITVDTAKGGCAAPFSTPELQMDSAVATVVDGALFFLVQCQGVVNSTLEVAPAYLVVRAQGGSASVLGSTLALYKDMGNSFHSPTLGWDAGAKKLVVGDVTSAATGWDPTSNSTIIYSTFDPATGEAEAAKTAPGSCPACADPKENGYVPYTGTGVMGDDSVYLRPYLHRWGPHLLPAAELLGFDYAKGGVAVNLTLGPAFYSMSREESSGDLVGLGLCCSPKFNPACPANCERPGSGPTFFKNATCGGACPAGSLCCRSPETAGEEGYCMDIPAGKTCGDLPATPGVPTFAWLRISGSGAGMKQAVVKTYNESELGDIMGSLATGGALSADGVYTHPVIFRPSGEGWPEEGRVGEQPATPADYHAWFRSFLAPNPSPGMHQGLVSIDAKTGDVLHIANASKGVGAFLRYV
jgi:hypothetical protein